MNAKNQNPEENEKYGGAKHIFLFLGIVVIAVIILKYVVDWLMK